MTKKYFEAVSPNGKKSPQFIAPLRKSGALTFVSMKTAEAVSKFVTVYTGVDLTPNEVFARMVDCGLVIESVEQTLSDITALLECAKASKLGHMYEASPSEPEFEFKCLGKLKAP
ncbi:MAG: hypothetical protein AAGB26_09395 [Planctomycetota bacterium]